MGCDVRYRAEGQREIRAVSACIEKTVLGGRRPQTWTVSLPFALEVSYATGATGTSCQTRAALAALVALVAYSYPAVPPPCGSTLVRCRSYSGWSTTVRVL